MHASGNYALGPCEQFNADERPQLKLESHNSEIVFMANAGITLQ